MNHLIIYAHPNPESFNCGIMQLVKKTLEEKGDAVTVRDLYANNFNPCLSSLDYAEYAKDTFPPDVQIEQQYVMWADSLIFIYPMWWGTMPAILKGYIDRVFSSRFAYFATNEGIEQPLKGKKGLLITTTGTAREDLEKAGVLKSSDITSNTMIFDFCGIKDLGHVYYTSVPYVEPSVRGDYLAELKELLYHTF